MVEPTDVPLLPLCAIAPGAPIRARSAIEMIVFFISLLPSQNSIGHLFMAAADMEMHLEAHHQWPAIAGSDSLLDGRFGNPFAGASHLCASLKVLDLNTEGFLKILSPQKLLPEVSVGCNLPLNVFLEGAYLLLIGAWKASHGPLDHIKVSLRSGSHLFEIFKHHDSNGFERVFFGCHVTLPASRSRSWSDQCLPRLIWCFRRDDAIPLLPHHRACGIDPCTAMVVYKSMANGQVVLITTEFPDGRPPVRSVYFVAEGDPAKAAAIVAAIMAPNERVEAWGPLPEAAVKALGLKPGDFTHGRSGLPLPADRLARAGC